MKFFPSFKQARVQSCFNRLFDPYTCSLVAMLVLTLTFTPAKALKEVGPKTRHPNLILKKIAGPLDPFGIDVLHDGNFRVKNLNDRLVLAPLSGYQTSLLLHEGEWLKEFKAGAIAGVAALETDEKIAPASFMAKWIKTSKEKRIFLSFAKEDFEKAKNVQAALESNGYVAFLYLSAENEEPMQSAEDVGRLLSSAGNHFILDSKTARTKQGVLAEIIVHKQILANSTPKKAAANSNAHKSTSIGERNIQMNRRITRSYIEPDYFNPQFVEIYGRTNCSRTQHYIKVFKDKGARVVFYDIDFNNSARLEVYTHSRYLYKGSELPFIKADGHPLDLSKNPPGRPRIQCYP